MKTRFLLFVFMLLLPLGAAGQDRHFSMDTDFLFRGEVRKGGLPEGEGSEKDFAAFLIERARLGVAYEHGILKTKFTAQHCGVWGDQNIGTFSVYEAWAQLQTKFGLFAKIGRQSLSYDDQRIFGADDWSMTGFSHDLVKLGFERGQHKVHLFAAFNQNAANLTGGTNFTGGLQPYKAMEAIWYHVDFPSIYLGGSLLFMNLGMQSEVSSEPNRTFQQQTMGAFLSFAPKVLSVEAAYYHQLGRNEGNLPIDSWMASIKASTSAIPHFRLTAGYDYLSGDPYFATPAQGQLGTTRHETIRGFSSVYGSHHKFYGAMDFFYVSTYVGGFTPGLQNLYFGVGWKPLEALGLDLSYHYLATAAKLPTADQPLGHELEFSISYAFTKDIVLMAGYSFMKGTATMEVLKRTSDKNRLHWGWIMLTVTPKFLNL